MVSESIRSDISVSVEPRIAVLGIGGAGCNIISGMCNISGSVDTIAINTDKASLRDTSANVRIYICKEVTKGEGTRGDASLGKKCAKVHAEEIENALSGYDVAFIVLGLGGGTGTGAAPVVAEICDRIGVKAHVIAVNPFFFEAPRVSIARESVRAIRAVCPNTIVIDNDHALKVHGDVSLDSAMKAVNGNIIGLIQEMIEKVPVIVSDDTDQDIGLLLPDISEHMSCLGLKA